MQTSIFLARLIGTTMLIAGIGILLNQKYYRAMAVAFIKSTPLFYVISVVGVVLGLTVVLFHNLWVADWRVIITLLGWINLIRGTISLICPETVIGYGTRINRNKNAVVFGSVFASVVGAILVYFGYLQGMIR